MLHFYKLLTLSLPNFFHLHNPGTNCSKYEKKCQRTTKTPKCHIQKTHGASINMVYRWHTITRTGNQTKILFYFYMHGVLRNWILHYLSMTNRRGFHVFLHVGGALWEAYLVRFAPQSKENHHSANHFSSHPISDFKTFITVSAPNIQSF